MNYEEYMEVIEKNERMDNQYIWGIQEFEEEMICIEFEEFKQITNYNSKKEYHDMLHDEGYYNSERCKEKQRNRNKEYFLSLEDWKLVMNYWGNKCAYSGKELDENNRSIDHIIPISKGGSNHLWNVVPCERGLNSSKNNKDLIPWLKKKGLYSLEKLKKIDEWQKFVIEKYEHDNKLKCHELVKENN